MEHISGIIKRVMESITVEDEPPFQQQFDESMGELDAEQARYDDEAEDGIGHAGLTGQENYDHENPQPLENPMDFEQ
jgi:hypothetical protein|tara:strand:- start:32 stop:262 length:231 start_codon:yes stop_codon:yes gene_type:complete